MNSNREYTDYLEDILEAAAKARPRTLSDTGRLKKDPADSVFLACALEARADFIVSGDKHLRNLKQFHGIRIIHVKEFVERVRKG